MRVDEPGNDVAPRRVEYLRTVVVADPRDDAVDDGDVRLQPLAREHGEHPTASDDEVGRLVAARDGETSLQLLPSTGA